MKNVLGVDLNACNNYKNGMYAAEKITQPVLTILGDNDKMCSLKMGTKLANVIKNNDLHIIKNCGHMMHLEEASKTLFILKNFIKANFPKQI